MRVIEAQCSWSWRLTITSHIKHVRPPPKRLRRLADPQDDLIWTVADATELDLAAAPNGYVACPLTSLSGYGA